MYNVVQCTSATRKTYIMHKTVVGMALVYNIKFMDMHQGELSTFDLLSTEVEREPSSRAAGAVKNTPGPG